MQQRVKCRKENKLNYIHDICNGVENGGEMTMEHETKLIDVSEQHSIDKVLFDDSILRTSLTLVILLLVIYCCIC